MVLQGQTSIEKHDSRPDSKSLLSLTNEIKKDFPLPLVDYASERLDGEFRINKSETYNKYKVLTPETYEDDKIRQLSLDRR